LALNGFKIGAETFNQRLQDFQPQEWVKITYFHQDRLQTVAAQLQAPQPSRYEVAPMPHPSPRQSVLLRGWLEA
jgi:predicted metalloprotease with PDZ domain